MAGGATAVVVLALGVTMHSLVSRIPCGVYGHGLGCEGYQLVFNRDETTMPFTFQRDVGLRDLLGMNMSHMCSNWVSMTDNVPAHVTLVPSWENEPTLFTFTCVVKTTEINERLKSIFPLKMTARGCGQAPDEHWELNTVPPAECEAQLIPGEIPFNIAIQLAAERHPTENLPGVHMWVHECVVAVSSSPIPREVGDDFTVDFVVNAGPARAVAGAAWAVLAAAAGATTARSR